MATKKRYIYNLLNGTTTQVGLAFKLLRKDSKKAKKVFKKKTKKWR